MSDADTPDDFLPPDDLPSLEDLRQLSGILGAWLSKLKELQKDQFSFERTAQAFVVVGPKYESPPIQNLDEVTKLCASLNEEYKQSILGLQLSIRELIGVHL